MLTPRRAKRVPGGEGGGTPPGNHLLEIGVVSKPHGVSGELKVWPHWEGSDTLENVAEVHVTRAGETRVHRVRGARRAVRMVLLRLEGISDRTAAEAYRGATISVPRDALPPLAEGEFYLADLVGARVVAPGGDLGEVVEVRSYPTVEAIVVRKADGSLAEQALAPPWLESVDVAARRVVLTTTEGLV